MTQKIFHLASALDLGDEVLQSIKKEFKAKPIRVIVEEDNDSVEIPDEVMAELDRRVEEEQIGYITAEASLDLLRKKYGV